MRKKYFSAEKYQIKHPLSGCLVKGWWRNSPISKDVAKKIGLYDDCNQAIAICLISLMSLNRDATPEEGYSLIQSSAYEFWCDYGFRKRRTGKTKTVAWSKCFCGGALEILENISIENNSESKGKLDSLLAKEELEAKTRRVKKFEALFYLALPSDLGNFARVNDKIIYSKQGKISLDELEQDFKLVEFNGKDYLEKVVLGDR